MTSSQNNSIVNRQRPVNLIEIAERNKATRQESQVQETSFKEMFSRELAESCNLQFSRHARERLYSRGVDVGDAELGRLAGAIDKAQTKGSRETLVLADDTAYVVSVPNRTVITVFDRDNLRDGVVTAIDSAVII